MELDVRSVLMMMVMIAGCKMGGGLQWSSSSGGGSTSGSPPATGTSEGGGGGAGGSEDTGGLDSSFYERRDQAWSDISGSRERAEAFYQKFAAAEIKRACGIDVKLTIDYGSFDIDHHGIHNVVGDNFCGQVPKLFSGVCLDNMKPDAIGRAAVKDVKAVHCEFSKGKLKVKPSVVIFNERDRHAYDWDNGTLTLKIGRSVADGFFYSMLLASKFPQVEWHRDVNMQAESLQRHFTRWSEDKDGVDFKVDVDVNGFSSANWIPAHYYCGGDGNDTRTYPERGKLAHFLRLVWDSTEKGKQLLRKVKRVTCSVTTEPKGKAAEIAGDQLIWYGRVVYGDHPQAAFFMDRKEKMPSNDSEYSYALFRKARNLGGDCPSGYDDKETARICGK